MADDSSASASTPKEAPKQTFLDMLFEQTVENMKYLRVNEDDSTSERAPKIPRITPKNTDEDIKIVVDMIKNNEPDHCVESALKEVFPPPEMRTEPRADTRAETRAFIADDVVKMMERIKVQSTPSPSNEVVVEKKFPECLNILLNDGEHKGTPKKHPFQFDRFVRSVPPPPPVTPAEVECPILFKSPSAQYATIPVTSAPMVAAVPAVKGESEFSRRLRQYLEMKSAASITPPATRQILTEDISEVAPLTSNELELSRKVTEYEDEIVSLKNTLDSVEGALARANEARDVQQVEYEEKISQYEWEVSQLLNKLDKSEEDQIDTMAELRKCQDKLQSSERKQEEYRGAMVKLQVQIARLKAAIEPICTNKKVENEEDSVDQWIEQLQKFFRDSQGLQLLNDQFEVQFAEYQDIVKCARKTTEYSTSLKEKAEKDLQMAQNTEKELKFTIEVLEQKNEDLAKHQKEYEMQAKEEILALVSQVNELTRINEDNKIMLKETDLLLRLLEDAKLESVELKKKMCELTQDLHAANRIKEDHAKLLSETDEFRKELADARTEINECKIKHFTLTQDLREYKELVDLYSTPVKILPAKLKKSAVSRSRYVDEDPERAYTEEELECLLGSKAASKEGMIPLKAWQTLPLKPSEHVTKSCCRAADTLDELSKQQAENERRNKEKDEEIETLKNQFRSVKRELEDIHNIREEMFNELEKVMLENEDLKESSEAESRHLQQRIHELEEKLKIKENDLYKELTKIMLENEELKASSMEESFLLQQRINELEEKLKIEENDLCKELTKVMLENEDLKESSKEESRQQQQSINELEEKLKIKENDLYKELTKIMLENEALKESSRAESHQLQQIIAKLKEQLKIRDNDMFNEIRKVMVENETLKELSREESHQLLQRITELEEKLKNNGFQIEFPESDNEAEAGDDDDEEEEVEDDDDYEKSIYEESPESSYYEDENKVEEAPQVAREEHEDWDLVN